MALVFAVMHLYDMNSFYCFSLFLVHALQSDTGKLTEWSTVPAYLSLKCIFNRGNTEGTNTSTKKKNVFDVCVCMFFINLCPD